MSSYHGLSPEEKFAAKLAELEAAVRAMRSGLYVSFVAADPDATYGNIWAFPDGRVRFRMPDGTIQESILTPDTGSVSTVPMPPPETQDQSFQSTWEPDWTMSYLGSGAQRSAADLYWGRQDSFTGIQASLVGLPYAAIQAALVNASITKVEVRLTVLDTGIPAGATVEFRGHANQTVPETLGGVGSDVLASAKVVGADTGAPQGWHAVSKALGVALAGGSTLGFTLSAKNADPEFYGQAAGLGSGVAPPALRVTYVK